MMGRLGDRGMGNEVLRRKTHWECGMRSAEHGIWKNAKSDAERGRIKNRWGQGEV